MKLLRGSCACGNQTQKVRSGYHFNTWWFPLYDHSTGNLSDISSCFPEEQIREFESDFMDQLKEPPVRNEQRGRELDLQVNEVRKKAKNEFLKVVKDKLSAKYSNSQSFVFAPQEGDLLKCLECWSPLLKLQQVDVQAFCKADCGHVYQLLDSEEIGCPKCKHRPHRFRTEIESKFKSIARVDCSCACSSTTDCISHIDGFCPKCGSLPVAYSAENKSFCGIHHIEMGSYIVPRNFLFMETASRWVSDQFPNAKLWGEADHLGEGFPSSYCTVCEADHQLWLTEHHDEQ